MKLKIDYKFRLIFLAVLLRLFVSAFLFHPDIKTINFQTSFLKKGVTNIYPYLAENKKTLPLRDEFVYFPLTYFTIGGYQAIASVFIGSGLDDWLFQAGTNQVVENPNIFKYLTLLKLPLLIFDIAIAFLLLKYFKDKKKGEKAFIFWLFNPFTIILIYAYSNIDIYAVLLTVIALILLKRKKLIYSLILLGIASAFKMYPLLFIPFLFLKGKSVREKILILVIPVLILLLTIIPFYSTDFTQSALVSGLTTRIFSPGISLGFGESIIMGLLLISALFFYGFFVKNKIKVFNYFLILLFIIFSFSHFHISWLLWIAPFLVILIVKVPKLTWPILIWSIIAFLIPLFYEDRSMTISLFKTFSTWYDLLPTPFVVIQKFYDPYSFQSMLHSALAGLSIILSYILIFEKNTLNLKKA